MRRVHYMAILFLFSIFGSFFITVSSAGSVCRDISISIASSSVFALLIEIGFWLNDRIKFGYLIGKWQRVGFFNRNMNESGLGYDDVSQRYSSIPKDIVLIYKEEGEYVGNATYEGGEVSFSLTIHKEKNRSGSGTYQYDKIRDQSITADIGHYSFLVDKNRNTIYISHQNVLPSGNAKGLEIWQRQSNSE